MALYFTDSSKHHLQVSWNSLYFDEIDMDICNVNKVNVTAEIYHTNLVHYSGKTNDIGDMRYMNNNDL